LSYNYNCTFFIALRDIIQANKEVKKEKLKMQIVTLRHHVGQDGILHLDIPVGLTDSELEVTITFKKVTPVKTRPENLEWQQFVERTYGSCIDAPIVIDNEGVFTTLVTHNTNEVLRVKGLQIDDLEIEE
jgi:hypothetical protein